jgi:hypothetical protein
MVFSGKWDLKGTERPPQIPDRTAENVPLSRTQKAIRRFRRWPTMGIDRCRDARGDQSLIGLHRSEKIIPLA